MADYMHERLMRPRFLLLALAGVTLTVLLLVISQGGPFGGGTADEPIAIAGASPQTTDNPPSASEPPAAEPAAGGPAGEGQPATGGPWIDYGDDGISASGGSGVISGFVSSGELIPLAGITVNLADGNGVLTGRGASTDAYGRFRFESLAPGSYRLFFSDPVGQYLPGWYGGGAAVTAGAGQETGIVFSMVRNNSPTGRITGLVSGSGGLGLAGIDVLVYEVDPPVILLELRATAVTAADGSYVVSGLPPGNYKVFFQPTGGYYSLQWYRDAGDHEAAELLPLHAGETVGKVDAALTQGGKVSGRVYDDGKPVPFVLVDVFDSTGVIVDSAVTDAQGYYVSEPLPDGFYKVRAAAGSGYSERWYGGTDDFYTASPVQLIAGETTGGIDILLKPPVAPPAVTAVASGGAGGRELAPEGSPPSGPEASGAPPASAAAERQPIEVAVPGQAEDGGLAGDDEE